MLFKGTKKRSAFDIVHSIEGAGGYLNAFTSTEYTCYYVRALDTQLQVAIEVLSDMITNPAFPVQELEKEKKVVLEEMKMYRDNPEEYISEEFTTSLFNRHPLGRPIIGFEKSVNSLLQADLYQYMSDAYRGPEIIVSAAGFLDHEYLVSQVETWLSNSLNTERAVKSQVPLKKESPFHLRKSRDIEQTHFLYGKRGISVDHPERFRLLLLNTILSGGMSSRLHQNIREKYGYCYAIYSYVQAFEDSGMFCVYTGTDQGYVGHVKELIDKEFQSLKDEKVSPEELKSAKQQLKGKLLLAQESMSNRMMRLGKNEIYYDRNVSLDELIGQIDGVTEIELQQFAQEFLDTENFSSALLTPE
jgi:predicted Zn-dependent peptidase